jgi:esterase/lipase
LNNAGFDVKLLTLPFHYERKPESSLFSGEYFWSADIVCTRNAFRQAVCEMYQIYTWFVKNSDKPIFITGFSMGGAVSLMLTIIYNEIRGLQIINPAAAFSDIVWDSPLCRTIRDDYIKAGYSIEDIQRAFTIFEPVGAKKIDIDRQRINLIYGLYDQVTDLQQYNKLIEKWGLKKVAQFNSGHLNILRVPRLADDITAFFKNLM